MLREKPIRNPKDIARREYHALSGWFDAVIDALVPALVQEARCGAVLLGDLAWIVTLRSGSPLSRAANKPTVAALADIPEGGGAAALA